MLRSSQEAVLKKSNDTYFVLYMNFLYESSISSSSRYVDDSEIFYIEWWTQPAPPISYFLIIS